VLKDQLKTGFLFVKAVDREGNSRLVVLKLLEKKQILNNYAIYVIIVLVIGVILALARRFKKQNV
jgi:1,4-dihydroxy-2-naphthoate octaprenyltransferase